MVRRIGWIAVGMIAMATTAWAADGGTHGSADRVQLELAALIGAGLWALVEKIAKPIAKKVGFDLTSNFAFFQPVLFGAATAITALLCNTGLCAYLVADDGEASPIKIVTSAFFSWIVAQFLHGIQPGTNTRVSSSGGHRTHSFQ